MGFKELLGFKEKQVPEIEEKQETVTQEPVTQEPEPEVDLDQLHEFAFSQLVASGKLPDLLKKAGITQEQRQSSERIPGTDLEKPMDFDEWDYERRNAYIASSLAEKARADAKRMVEESEQRVLGSVAPVLRAESVKRVADMCSPQAKSYVDQALKDIEKRYGRPVTSLNENDAWLVTQRAEAIAAQQYRQVETVSNEGLPEGGGNPKVIEFMKNYNKAMPEKPIDYAKAEEWAKEDGIV